MKNLTLVVLSLLISSMVLAQTSFEVAGGVATGGSPVVGMAVSESFNPVFVKVGLDLQTSRAITKGSLFSARVGYNGVLSDKVSFEPAVGYGYLLRSNDYKDLNSHNFLGSLFLLDKVAPKVKLGVGTTYLATADIYLFTGVVRFALD